MSRQHMMMFLAIFIITSVFGIFLKMQSLEETSVEKEKIDLALDYATDCAATALSTGFGDDNVLCMVTYEFFTAFSLQYGYTDPALKLYVPLFIFCDTDGFYAGGIDAESGEYVFSDIIKYRYETDDFCITFFLDDRFVINSPRYTLYCKKETYFGTNFYDLTRYEQDTVKTAKNLFSAYDFQFTEENYEEIKTLAVINSIKAVSEEYINIHNAIAESYGLVYDFSVPQFNGVSCQKPSFIVCFQGYPVTANGMYYENFKVRAARIKKI